MARGLLLRRFAILSLVDVLQPVRRRRRRRRQQLMVLPLLVLLAAAAVAASVVAREHGHSLRRQHARPSRRAAASTGRLRRTTPAHERRTAPLLRPARAQSFALRRPVAARAAILVDAGNGDVLYARYPHRKLPIASTTKIMTALLVLTHDSLDQTVRIAPSVPQVPLVKEGLRAGERVVIWKLLYGLLLYSGNDDALALALATSGTRDGFLRLMNREAQRLGLSDTHFNTPSGVLDERNYSTAWDLAALTRVALRNKTFRHIVRTRIERVRWAPPTYAKVYVNRNLLLWDYPGTIGVKTGYTTAAGPCLVAAATRRHHTLIAVLLHDPHSYADAIRLFRHGWRAHLSPT